MKKAKRKKVSNSQAQSDSKTLLKRILIVNAVGVLTAFALLSLFSLIIMKQSVPSIFMTAAAIFSFAVSAFLIGFLTVRPVRKNGIVLGSIANLPFLVLSLAALLTVSAGKPGIILVAVIAAIVVFGMIGGILAVNLRKRTR